MTKKGPKQATINFRVPPNVRDQFVKLARAEGRSQQTCLTRMLDEWIKKREVEINQNPA